MASADTSEKTEIGQKPLKSPVSVAPDLDSTLGNVGKGRFGAVPKDRERKIGHRRVDETGTVTYKKKTTSELQAAIQLGIGQSVGGLSSKPERDLLMQDFAIVQSVVFPSEGSNMTPAHHYSDFRFKTYAPLAFRYFRELFNIRPDDFMLSLCDEPMTELSNPGAGGSIFYITADDEFIIKTAQHKEANFLQKLLPGYYMNLNQNPRTLLPKFYGLYCYQCGGKNIRFVVMNNILPSVVKLHEKYDLKGSTYKRKASKTERAKSSPTLKDLDFQDLHPEGLLLEKDTYDALIKTVSRDCMISKAKERAKSSPTLKDLDFQDLHPEGLLLEKTVSRDCMVLESFKIMDYSLLVGIHNLDKAKNEKSSLTDQGDETAGVSTDLSASQRSTTTANADPGDVTLARGKSIRTKVTQYSTPMESIQAEVRTMLDEFDDEDIPPGGIPAKNAKGERLLLYLGIIDILQCYRFRKKFEHSLKSMITDGDTISVTRPSFYAERFLKFFTNTVFRKAPSPKEKMKNEKPLKHSPSKRKGGGRTTSMNEEQTHVQPIPGTTGARPDILMGSATPPPTFAEAINDARPRDKLTMSPGAKSESDVQRSGHFQTIQQQEDRAGNMKVRYSPLSVSESTPTYTEFTEGTPSYTASSPSCSSDVLDSNIPNLPLERETVAAGATFQEPRDSPSRYVPSSISSGTQASFHSTTSHVEQHAETRDMSQSAIVSRSADDHISNNSTTQSSKANVTRTVIVSTSSDEKVVRERNSLGLSGDAAEGSIMTMMVNSGEAEGNKRGGDGEPRVSVTSHRTDSSFSSQSTVDGGYTESIVSATTTESTRSEQSSTSSWSKSDVAVMTGGRGSGGDVPVVTGEENVSQVEESTHL